VDLHDTVVTPSDNASLEYVMTEMREGTVRLAHPTRRLTLLSVARIN